MSTDQERLANRAKPLSLEAYPSQLMFTGLSSLATRSDASGSHVLLFVVILIESPRFTFLDPPLKTGLFIT